MLGLSRASQPEFSREWNAKTVYYILYKRVCLCFGVKVAASKKHRDKNASMESQTQRPTKEDNRRMNRGMIGRQIVTEARQTDDWKAGINSGQRDREGEHT